MKGIVLTIALASGSLWAAEWEVAVQGLRTYCKACHAVGERRFIRSDDDREVWEYLFENAAPGTKIPWAEAIQDVLDWPSDSAPPTDQWLDPPDRDWMPKGIKRLWFSKATHQEESLRALILRALKNED